MNILTRTMSGIAICGCVAMFPLSQAFALDQDAVLARFKAAMALQGTPVSWAQVDHLTDAQGNDGYALSGVTLDINGEKMPLKTGISLHNVTEDGAGGYRVGMLQIPAFDYSEAEVTAWVGDITFNGVSLPAEGAKPGPLGNLMNYEGSRLAYLTVIVNEKQVMELRDLHVELTPAADGAPMQFTGACESFTAELSRLKDPQQRAIAAALGYPQITGYFELAGTWQPTDGVVQLNRFEVSVVDAGTIGLNVEIGGYTPDFIQSMRQVQAMMAANTGGDNSAAGFAVLGLLQQLTFRNASIYFLDDTLTNRVLDFVASQQGARSKDVANQAKAMVPFMLMQLNNPELTAMATDAVSAFIDDPQSIEVVANPAAPVPFAMIMAGAMSAPQTLPQQLGVKINANK